MKKYFLLILLLLGAASLSTAQTKNEKLYEAIEKNQVQQVEVLLKKKANPNYEKKIGEFGMSVLITAVMNQNPEVVRLLINYGAQVDKRDLFNSTALMYAAAKGNLEIAGFLIENGADVKADDGRGNTVLSAAKESKKPEVVALVENKLKEVK